MVKSAFVLSLFIQIPSDCKRMITRTHDRRLRLPLAMSAVRTPAASSYIRGITASLDLWKSPLQRQGGLIVFTFIKLIKLAM